MGKGLMAAFAGASLLLFLAGFSTLPTSRAPLDTLQSHARLALHLLGAAPKERVPRYGRIEPKAPRPANGTIKEVQGFVSAKVFRERYLMKEPVVFRGAATPEWGFNLECLAKPGKSVKDTLAEQMGDRKVRIFKDQYDDTSAELMTIKEYQHLAEEADRNASAPMPYARAFPQSSMRDCAPVPTDRLKEYHSWFGALSQTYIPEPDTSVCFASYAEHTNTKMHIDVGDSFVTQVYGRKKWLFVDPEYALDMKIWGDRLNLVFIAGYDVHREAVPPEIPFKEVIAYPGDVIYFPSMTFHAAYNLDPVTVMVDNAAADVLGAFGRHWFLTAATVLNPWTLAKALSIYFNTGSFSCTELYFDGFVGKEDGEL